MVMEIDSGKLVTLQSGHQPYFLAGLDANKSSSPGIGDTYYSTDTQKTYNCYVAGSWVLTSSPAKERYSNHLGALDNFTQIITGGSGGAGLAAGTTDAANHQMHLSTGNNGWATYAYWTTKKQWQLSNNAIIVNIIVRNVVPGNGNMFWGLKNDWTSLPNSSARLNCCELYVDPGVSMVVTGDATGYTSTAFPLGFTSGDKITIIATSNVIYYLKNGVIIVTHTTHIPTAMLSMGASATSAGGMDSAIDVDLIDIEVLG